MAITAKPLLALVVALITIITIHTHTVNSKEEVTFNFEKFDEPTPGDYCSPLTFEGDAAVVDKEIHLTKLEKNRVGRVSYSHPIRLYDSKTGEVARITTEFKFVNVQPDYSRSPAEGMAFFIAPYKSVLPSNSYGAHLGLQTGPPAGPGENPPVSHDNFVAVEFDTRFQKNYGDPVEKHFGIDVNSVVSIPGGTTPWRSWENDGETEFVTITYDPSSTVLKVVAKYNGNKDDIELSSSVDLKKVLPEWVTVGFSASTGEDSEKMNIKSWSFSSVLEKVTHNNEAHIASVV